MPDRIFYKVLSHNLRPPLQGGDPLPIETLPYTTEAVKLDTSARDCAAGWHCVDDLAAGFRIAGLWRDGRPVRVFEVEPSDDVLQRGNKFRSSTLTFTRELDLDGIERGIFDLSKPFGRFRKEMTAEQLAWYQALGRPECDPEKVEAGLRAAVGVRDLDWNLKRFDTARDAWDAWDAWAARDARAAWDAWDAWAARDAWAAWAALVVTYASKQGWIEYPSGLLTTGVRDAYHAGLGIVLPTGPNELGWAMDSEAGRP